MDNIRFRIKQVTVHLTKLRAALKADRIKPKLGYDEDSQLEEIRFSCTVGKFEERWLIRLYLKTNSITCSGGVTKTFFGHNLWVFNNEWEQLQAIVGIVTSRLAEIDGIVFPDNLFDAVEPERVELTNHFRLPPPLTQADAIDRANSLFMVLFPKRHDSDGKTLDDPGTASIGKNKSSKVCRVYDPCSKFKHCPKHISQESWASLMSECDDHLRVEIIMTPRDIERLKLDHIDAWKDTAKIDAFLAKKHKHFGLTVDYRTSSNSLTVAEVQKAHPTFVEYARYWFSEGERGTPPDKRSGSANRFRQYMEENGFNINIPLKHHAHLAHGLHEILEPGSRADISPEVRADKELFGQWWNKK